MIRRNPKRPLPAAKKWDEEYGQDVSDTKPQNSGNMDNVIANMAQGFVQTQANTTGVNTTLSNQEVITLLQTISSQLAQLQQQNSQFGPKGNGAALQGQSMQQRLKSQQVEQNQQQGQQANQNQNQVTQELQNLFSQILKGSNNQNQVQQKDTPSTSGSASAQGQQQNSNSKMAVQTAAQVLAQAQYELSTELEASLKRLKQVISESEKIANKISNLLGQENGKQQ